MGLAGGTEERAMETLEFGPVRYELSPPVARVVLNDPARRNAQSSEMVRGVQQALALARRDHAIRVVIVKAAGETFCSGHLRSIEAYPEFQASFEHKGTAYEGQSELFLWPMLEFWEFPKPTIAQVQGAAVQGGTYWALLTDLTLASEDATFQMPSVRWGLPGSETMIEPWLFMNWKRASEYLYTGRLLRAAEACQMGLVNRVVPATDLERETETTAAHIAEVPGTTLLATKSLIKRAWELMGMRVHLQMSNDLVALASQHRDVLEFIADSRRRAAGKKAPSE
jgi:enoyl-CoA hydratase/carnithine racemase